MGRGEFVVVHFLGHRARIQGTDIRIGLVFHIDQADGGEDRKNTRHDRDHLGLAKKRGQRDYGG